MSVAETLEMCIEISPILTIEPRVETDSVNWTLLDSKTSSSSPSWMEGVGSWSSYSSSMPTHVSHDQIGPSHNSPSRISSS
jgi:hypothetical protein